LQLNHNKGVEDENYWQSYIHCSVERERTDNGGNKRIGAHRLQPRIVCNEDGDCWHAKTDYEYQPAFGLSVHPNDWKWKEGEKHAWREHEGKGYWHGGSWKEF
jgi:hypothetical protein